MSADKKISNVDENIDIGNGLIITKVSYHADFVPNPQMYDFHLGTVSIILNNAFKMYDIKLTVSSINNEFGLWHEAFNIVDPIVEQKLIATLGKWYKEKFEELTGNSIDDLVNRHKDLHDKYETECCTASRCDPALEHGDFCEHVLNDPIDD